MKIALAADHGGFDMKQGLITRLREAGHEVRDFGAAKLDPDDDYPDYIIPLARAVAGGEVDRGIVICGSGVGASVAANKVKGIRAGLCHDHYSVRQGVEDDDMNVLCLGGRVMGIEVAWDHAQTFISATFSGAERHRRRLAKVARLEEQSTGPREPVQIAARTAAGELERFHERRNHDERFGPTCNTTRRAKDAAAILSMDSSARPPELVSCLRLPHPIYVGVSPWVRKGHSGTLERRSDASIESIHGLRRQAWLIGLVLVTGCAQSRTDLQDTLARRVIPDEVASGQSTSRR